MSCHVMSCHVMSNGQNRHMIEDDARETIIRFSSDSDSEPDRMSDEDSRLDRRVCMACMQQDLEW
jgi:hypothetical protein